VAEGVGPAAPGGISDERSDYEARSEFRTHAGRVLSRRNRRDLELLREAVSARRALLRRVMQRQKVEMALIMGGQPFAASAMKEVAA
jgi:hypothetical protein